MTDPTQTPTVCYRHHDRPTRLACSECGKPICVECSSDAAVGQKCPECSKPPGRYRVINARSAVGGPSFATSPVSFTIIAVTVVIFALGFVSAELNDLLRENFALVKAFVREGEWWRALTSAFLHGSVMHILFNMYALYLLGPRLEREVGSAPFALFYLATAATGSAASVLFGPEVIVSGGTAYLASSVGASGAIFGLFGAWLFIGWKMRGQPAGRAMFNQLAVLLAINLALPLIVGGIDWRAHLGGLVGGVAIAFLWSVFAVGRTNARVIRSVIAAAVLIATLIVLATL